MLATRMRMAAAGVTGGGADWWVVAGKTCVAAYQPIGAASLAASYTNLANPGTYDAAPGVAPTFDAATGWTFNGSTQYLTTGVVPTSGWSALVQWWAAAPPISPYLFGSVKSTATSAGFAFRAGNVATYFWNGQVKVAAASGASGNHGFAGQTAYANGSAIAGAIGAWSGVNDLGVFLGGFNYDGGLAGQFTGRIYAFAVYSDILSGAEVATVAAAMAALT